MLRFYCFLLKLRDRCSFLFIQITFFNSKLKIVKNFRIYLFDLQSTQNILKVRVNATERNWARLNSNFAFKVRHLLVVFITFVQTPIVNPFICSSRCPPFSETRVAFAVRSISAERGSGWPSSCRKVRECERMRKTIHFENVKLF